MKDMLRYAVQFSVYPMACKRVRIEALTKCGDDKLWAVHVDVGPIITEGAVANAVDMLLFRIAQRAQTESSNGVIEVEG